MSEKKKTFKRGDYVVYTTKGELGRVVEDSGEYNTKVCYSTGCTGASTPNDMLIKAADLNKDYPNIRAIDIRQLGFHRFDESCPDYNPDYCYRDCYAKFGLKGD